MEKLTKNLRKNVLYFKELFKDCDDILFREYELGDQNPVKVIAIFVDGLADQQFASSSAISSMFLRNDLNNISPDESYEEFLDKLIKEAIASPEIKKEDKIDTIVNSILSGDTILFLENADKAIILGTRGGPARGIDEPKTETVIRGPRDGFNEMIKFNTALVRRRIKDNRFKIKFKQVGSRSKTNIALLYIEDIVDQKLLLEVEKRLDNINIDAVLDSGILENLIEDNYLSPFPQVENTERPDAVAASLYEGRVSLIVDNSPFALVVPATLGTLMQSSEDYYTRWMQTTFVRLLRVVAIFLSFLSPAIYIAVTAYHPGVLPTQLIYFLAASRINVPFPAVIEATIMELTMELLREAGTRLSGPIGTTIGIVGGLIIGQAAVEAGIVSPLMIIIVAITTISTFAIPSYELATGFRFIKFGFIVLAGILGLYGIMLGLILLISHFVKLSSFGIPFTSPFTGLGVEEGDIKDTLVKVPAQRLWLRPGFTNPQNKRRMRWKDEE